MASVVGQEQGEPARTAAATPADGARDLDPVSASWVRELSSAGVAYETACARLHADLLRIAKRELARRRSRFGFDGPEADDLAHQAAADALLAITRKIGDFRGESRFTTWAYRFVVLEVSAKIGRHFWSTGSTQRVELDGEDWDRLPDRLGAGPAESSEARALAAAVRTAADEVLTRHQRRVFVSLVLDAVPLDALVLELGSSRNAVYKTMFDARRRLRDHLVAHGYLDVIPGRRS
ncbi:RNA polymerase sigma factor [Streptomyces sp. NPDC008092]|uniref:RNA polymerase sigma factor n=1 Tax=Streptomyces sp. NPDC008092 TaxID=3364808 RepID=UPI0036E0711A